MMDSRRQDAENASTVGWCDGGEECVWGGGGSHKKQKAKAQSMMTSAHLRRPAPRQSTGKLK